MEGDGSFTDAGVIACSCLSVCVCVGEVCVAVMPTQSQALQLTAVQRSVLILKSRTGLLSWPRGHGGLDLTFSFSFACLPTVDLL